MIKSIGVLLVGVAMGGALAWFATGAGDGSAESRLDLDAPVDEVVANLNARLADGDSPAAELADAAYRDWGAADTDAALGALDAIEPAAARRAAALALLDIVGADEAGANRIAAALRALERPSFLADWLGQRAATDPQGAFRRMLAFDNASLRSMAAERIASAWAALDPAAALAESMLLPDDEATVFRRNVLGEWARIDPGAVLSMLETSGIDSLELIDALSVFAAEPESLLAVAERRSDPSGASLRSLALTMLADTDAPAAIARVEAMPAGAERDSAVMSVSMIYAVNDPEGAMSWIERMLPASPNARMLVAVGLAEQDPARALELLGSGAATTQENRMLLGLIVQSAAADSNRAQSLAEKLLASDDPQSQTYLANLMSGWVARDAEEALNWALEPGSDLPPALLGNAAAALANRDPEAAASYIERMPPQHRDVWITRMAGPYGRNNLDEAVDWIGRYRGQPVFEPAYAQLISQAAQTDPRAAAERLAAASASVQREAAGAVATNWARQDPQAAVEWALTLNDADARVQGIAGAVQQLARQQTPDDARALLQARVGDAALRDRIAEQAGLPPAP